MEVFYPDFKPSYNKDLKWDPNLSLVLVEHGLKLKMLLELLLPVCISTKSLSVSVCVSVICMLSVLPS